MHESTPFGSLINILTSRTYRHLQFGFLANIVIPWNTAPQWRDFFKYRWFNCAITYWSFCTESTNPSLKKLRCCFGRTSNLHPFRFFKQLPQANLIPHVHNFHALTELGLGAEIKRLNNTFLRSSSDQCQASLTSEHRDLKRKEQLKTPHPAVEMHPTHLLIVRTQQHF